MHIHLKILSFCLLLFMFCGWSHSNAQSAEFGITRGINISSHADKFVYKTEGPNVALTPKVTTNLHIGLIARKKLSTLRLQFEPSITKLGARYDEPITLQGEEFQTKSETQLKYLQLPLQLQFPVTPTEENLFSLPLPDTYYLTSGIFGGYLLDARFEGTNIRAGSGSSSGGESFSEDVIIQYSKYDGGVMLGAGFEYRTKVTIGFETRVQYTAFQSYQGTPTHRPRNTAVTVALFLLL